MRRAWYERLASGTQEAEIEAEIAGRQAARQRAQLEGPARVRLAARRVDPEGARQTWALVSAQLERSLPPTSYATWFRPLVAVDQHDRRLMVRAPTDEFARRITTGFQAAIDAALAACGLTTAVDVFSAEQETAAAIDELMGETRVGT